MLPAKGVDLSSNDKKAIRVSKNLVAKQENKVKESVDVDAEEGEKTKLKFDNDNEVFKNFVSRNGIGFVDNDNITVKNVKTYFIFDKKSNVPSDINNPRKTKIHIINDISWNVGGSDQTKLCIFDPKKKDNVPISNLKSINDVNIGLRYISEIKGKDTNVYDKTEFNKLVDDNNFISKSGEIEKLFSESDNKEKKKSKK